MDHLKRMGTTVTENYVSKSALAAMVLWGAAVSLMTAGWVVALATPVRWQIGVLLVATSLLVAGFAIVIHIKVFMARICRLIRVTSGFETEAPQLRSVR